MKFLFGFITCLVLLVGARFAWIYFVSSLFMGGGAATVTETTSAVPFNDGTTATSSAANTATTLPDTTAGTPAPADWLTSGQRAALATFGIDESKLPKELTPTMEACFVTSIGASRVAEVKAGATPTVFEMGKAAHCL